MGTVSPTTEPLSTKMGVFFLLFILVPTSLASQNCTSIQDFLNSTDISECNSTTLRAFLSFFNIEDDGKMVEHTEALCVHLNTIKEQNENYVEGKSTWYSCVYDFDSLTPEEFQKQKTGAITSEDDAVDDRSEQFFDKYRYSRASVPASYSSVDRDNGYIKLERGSNMCGIGKKLAVTKCSGVSGPTEGPRTTKKQCFDKYSNCPKLAETSCYQDLIAKGCPKSCGLCPDLTPARSYTCYNKSGR